MNGRIALDATVFKKNVDGPDPRGDGRQHLGLHHQVRQRRRAPEHRHRGRAEHHAHPARQLQLDLAHHVRQRRRPHHQAAEQRRHAAALLQWRQLLRYGVRRPVRVHGLLAVHRAGPQRLRLHVQLHRRLREPRAPHHRLRERPELHHGLLERVQHRSGAPLRPGRLSQRRQGREPHERLLRLRRGGRHGLARRYGDFARAFDGLQHEGRLVPRGRRAS